MDKKKQPIRTDSFEAVGFPVVGVAGLGYVGLPVAIAFGEKFRVIGMDTNKNKINQLSKGIDPNGELSTEQLENKKLEYVSKPYKLQECTHIIVAVPTPITDLDEPDLTLLKDATKMIGENLSQHTTIIYESTVYPGTTEEVCIPLLEKYSGFTAGIDFQVGYSPERINPGDEDHTFKNSPKVIAGQTPLALENIYTLYEKVLEADIYKAPNIKVAEAAKIIENTQRDINIAFMNELSLIFEKLEIDTDEVLQAANTKWNFLPFSPGLVGGHCIGVDPYYLIYKSKQKGYMPTFITAARTLNESMPEHVVYSLLKLAMLQKLNIKDVRITVLGITFKENIADIRNSKSIEIVNQLQQLGLSIQICDPYAPTEINGIPLTPFHQLKKSSVLILTVPHKEFLEKTEDDFLDLLSDDYGIIMDLKGIFPVNELNNYMIWRM